MVSGLTVGEQCRAKAITTSDGAAIVTDETCNPITPQTTARAEAFRIIPLPFTFSSLDADDGLSQVPIRESMIDIGYSVLVPNAEIIASIADVFSPAPEQLLR